MRKYTPVARRARRPKIEATAVARSTPTISVTQNEAPCRVARIPTLYAPSPRYAAWPSEASPM